jgi:cytochrome P450
MAPWLLNGLRTVFEPTARQAWLIATALVLTTIGFALHRLYLHPLARFPGPFAAKLSGSWRNKRYWRGTWHDDIVDAHKRYGPIVRIAPNELSVTGQEVLKPLYGHGSNAVKTHWYATWDPPIGAPALFPARDRKVHAFLRKRVSAAYSMSSILRYEPFIQGCLDLLIVRLQEYASRGEEVNMSNMSNAFAFDVVGELAYGAPLGHLETGTDVNNLRKTIYDMFIMMSCMGNYPGQMRTFTNQWTQALMKALGVKNPFASFEEWGMRRVRARSEALEKGIVGSEGRFDMLAHFLQMKKQDGNPARFEEVLAEALNLV